MIFSTLPPGEPNILGAKAPTIDMPSLACFAAVPEGSCLGLSPASHLSSHQVHGVDIDDHMAARYALLVGKGEQPA